MVRYSVIDTAQGEVWIAGDGESISHINFPTQRTMERGPHKNHQGWQRDDGSFIAARQQLQAYFAGELQTFDLKLAPQGTEFQQQVWGALLQVPFGEVCSYSDIAQRIGKPKAVRAVGAANGRNPIPIVIPCHRIIGSSGKLTGYAGGIELKEALLRLEGVLPEAGQGELL